MQSVDKWAIPPIDLEDPDYQPDWPEEPDYGDGPPEDHERLAMG